MPRLGRIILPDYPHHLVQRGHNRQVVFAEPRDFERYLETLAEFKEVYGVKVYAYCLMTNHVHLLMAPETVAGLGQLMKRLAGRQTRYHNTLEGRSGTLWERPHGRKLLPRIVPRNRAVSSLTPIPSPHALTLTPSPASGRGMRAERAARDPIHSGRGGRAVAAFGRCLKKDCRYKSSPVDTDDYLLACTRYIELNPVRARMVAAPEHYRWSSCRGRLGEAACEWLDPDPCYLALGATAAQRQARYREFLQAAIPEGEWRLIRDAVQRGQLTGNPRFVDKVAEILGKRIEHRSRGRPAKKMMESVGGGVGR